MSSNNDTHTLYLVNEYTVLPVEGLSVLQTLGKYASLKEAAMRCHWLSLMYPTRMFKVDKEVESEA